MRLAWLSFALTLSVVAPPASAQPQGDTLTLERAIQIAMAQQPQIRQTRAAIDAANARVDLAKTARNPTVTLSASVDYGSSAVRPCADDATKSCGGFFDPTASTGLGARADWRIYDFGQTSANVRAARLSAEATAATATTTTLDIRTDVEQAFLEAVARRRLVQVAETTVKSEETHLDQAKKFVAAQAKDPIEVAQAQARAANARSTLAQAQSAEAIALANLRAAIGWLDATHSPVVAPEWPTPPAAEPPALPALVEASRRQRPEILQLDKQIAASEAELDAAIAERRPTLSATASTQYNPSENDWSPQPSWSAGLTLSWSLFDGGRASANQKIARANVTGAQAQRDALLVSLTSQLDAARAQIIANRDDLRARRSSRTART